MTHLFASDNCAPACPEIIEAVCSVGKSHAHSYGDDAITALLQATAQELFAAPCKLYPVFTGTAANILALGAVCRPGQGVLAAPSAHVHCDEGGAMEAITSLKLLPVEADQYGKLSIASLRNSLHDIGNVHRVQAKLITISQSTEWGGLYSAEEISEIANWAHDNGLLLHMDGARFPHAVAATLRARNPSLPALELTKMVSEARQILQSMSSLAGVDLLSLGATKCGAMGAEALVVFPRDYLRDIYQRIPYLQKTFMQLGSKMRYVSIQINALYSGDLWLRNAFQAVDACKKLEEGIRNLGLVPLVPALVNALFVKLNPKVIKALVERFGFHEWDHGSGLVRLMTSWDSTSKDVQEFIDALEQALGLGTATEGCTYV